MHVSYLRARVAAAGPATGTLPTPVDILPTLLSLRGVEFDPATYDGADLDPVAFDGAGEDRDAVC